MDLLIEKKQATIMLLRMYVGSLFNVQFQHWIRFYKILQDSIESCRILETNAELCLHSLRLALLITHCPNTQYSYHIIAFLPNTNSSEYLTFLALCAAYIGC